MAKSKYEQALTDLRHLFGSHLHSSKFIGKYSCLNHDKASTTPSIRIRWKPFSTSRKRLKNTAKSLSRSVYSFWSSLSFPDLISAHQRYLCVDHLDIIPQVNWHGRLVKIEKYLQSTQTKHHFNRLRIWSRLLGRVARPRHGDGLAMLPRVRSRCEKDKAKSAAKHCTPRSLSTQKWWNDEGWGWTVGDDNGLGVGRRLVRRRWRGCGSQVRRNWVVAETAYIYFQSIVRLQGPRGRRNFIPGGWHLMEVDRGRRAGWATSTQSFKITHF